MVGIPSPASVGHRTRRRTVSVPPVAADRLSRVFRQLNLSPSRAAGSSSPSLVRYDSLLARQPVAFEVVSDWRDALDSGRDLTVAESILFEWLLCWDPLPIRCSLPPRMDYLKTLQVSRERASIALHDYARDVNWRRPVVYIAALQLARSYLRSVVSDQSLTNPGHMHEFTGRLGVSTLLINRFIDVPYRELSEAAAWLSRSMNQGNNSPAAATYWLEAKCRLFDLTKDRQDLSEAAAQTSQGPFQKDPNVRLELVDAALRLSDVSLLGLGRIEELPAYLRRVGSARGLAVDQGARTYLMAALVQECVQRGIPLLSTGLPRLPFDLRKPHPSTGLLGVMPALCIGLEHSPFADEPLARSLIADMALHLEGLETASAEQLKQRIALRSWTRVGSDDRDYLLRARDQLTLARRFDDKQLRTRTLEELVGFSERSPSASASALVLISTDVGANGGCAMPTSASSTVRDAIDRGESDTLLLDAAASAERSPDLFPVPLGGRSDVTTVGDLYDLVGQTFVFKRINTEALAREARRADALNEALRSSGMNLEFGAVSLRPLRQETGLYSVAVRRFELGSSARDYLERMPDQLETIMSRVATFLGWMNRVEGSSRTELGRRSMKSGELGMWLKTLGHDDPASFFNRWWRELAQVPASPRRDAHLDNWIVTDAGRILAIDLEAQQHRPWTYELAQVTEDSAQIAPADWPMRTRILRQYSVALDDALDPQVLQRTYEASVLARAVRHLTMPRDGGRFVQHGIRVLQSLREMAGTTSTRAAAEEILAIFTRTRGAPESFFSATMPDRVRQRYSKRLAYLLRHDASVQRDAGGWVSIDAASTLMSIPPSLTVEVASHPDERRFEVRADAIRARYGHSVPVNIEHRDLARGRELLYHGTSTAAASSILRDDGGLLRMGRQWVHLTTGTEDAFAAALRKGEPVVLVVLANGLAQLSAASDTTVLTPYVPPHLVRVAPVSFIWDAVPITEGAAL